MDSQYFSYSMAIEEGYTGIPGIHHVQTNMSPGCPTRLTTLSIYSPLFRGRATGFRHDLKPQARCDGIWVIMGLSNDIYPKKNLGLSES
jgi:hypothetical protein